MPRGDGWTVADTGFAQRHHPPSRHHRHARYRSATSGRASGPGRAWQPVREQFSIRVTTVAVVAFLLANLGLVVSKLAGLGAATEMFGVTGYLSVPIAAVAGCFGSPEQSSPARRTPVGP
jgi:hypothetical protein